MSKKEQLFEEFSSVSLEKWQEKIEKDLKGKSFSELEWTHSNIIDLIPNYNKENSKNSEAQIQFSSKENKDSNDWKMSVFILVTTEKEANALALKALSNGVNSITFVGEINDLETLLQDVMIEIISIDYITPQTSEFVEKLKNLCSKRNINFEELAGSISFDFLGNFARKGNWHSSIKHISEECIAHLEKNKSSQLNSLTTSNSYFQQSGANTIQQLGIALAHGVEYFDLLNASVSNQDIANNLQFHFGIGGNYFAEIAKIRAFRVLWNRVLSAFETSTEKVTINAVTSSLLWSDKQPKNNMLRATSSAMSAIIGGCDSLTIAPFDSVDSHKESFSERIASNVQLILKEESYLDKVVDPASGSYFIENLTAELAEKGWQFFQEIEKNGGYIKALESGFIQNEIEKSANELILAFGSGELNLVGVNKFETDDKKVTLQKVENSGNETTITPLTFLQIK